MQFSQDTICALATPNGVGAIGVIRLSGSESWRIVSSLFSKNLAKCSTHTTHFGILTDQNGDLLDEVLVTVFANGRSFTGEESVEISCHGSMFIQQKIITALLNVGARMANAGEFTQRAFLNGKLDLSQAEAVADLIASQSKAAHELALNQLRGGLSNELKLVREKLIDFAALVELELDFGEEDVEFADRTLLKELIKEVLDFLHRMADSFELGNAIKNGVPVALVGAPNTGKSTLLNVLLGEDRAIVSSIAGTTRDVIEETLLIEGILFRLIDTAGIRESEDEIETMGIQRSKEKIEQANLVVCMADATDSTSISTVIDWTNELTEKYPSKKCVAVINKTDVKPSDIPKNSIGISAKDNKNIESLKKWMVSSVLGNYDMTNETIVSNARHEQALRKTIESLDRAQNGIDSNITGDFIAMDIRQAMHWLGSITGQISEDDLLASIFGRFCIGK